MPVENQVAIIYAVTNGYLDQVPVDRVRPWERGFHEYLSSRAPEILKGIREEKALSDDLEKELVAAIKAFDATFSAEQAAAKPAAAAPAAAPAAKPAAPAKAAAAH